MASESDELYNTIAKMMKDDDSKSKRAQGSSYQLVIPSISRVPETLRKLKESAYTPRVVSIGPLHRGDERLKGMQKHKVSYMYTLFDRTAKSQETREDDADQTLRECVDAMLEAAPRARTCYAETFEDEYTNVELANTLLVDGCFILELLFRYQMGIRDSNDPVLMNNLALVGIICDLVLLENQIPFFVLQQLFHLTLEKTQNLGDTLFRLHFVWMESKLSLKQYVLGFFGPVMIFGGEMSERDNGTTETSYDHIIGFLHNYYKPASASNGYPGNDWGVKYSATQLHRTGVKFMASEGNDYVRVRFRTSTTSERRNQQVLSPSNCFLFSWLQPAGNSTDFVQLPLVNENGRNHRICTPTSSSSICCLFSPLRTLLPKTPPSKWCLFQLCSSACLELPSMRLYDGTELFLRNLIAYEQCCPTVPQYISSYAFLMDTLVDSKEDVELLVKEGVLQNHLGANEDASDLFNNLCKEISVAEFYFSDQWKELNNYCNLYCPKHLALLRSTYFSNPWAIISLIGALLLFGLTAIQTAYSIK